MKLRSLLLKIMLGAMALAALGGVTAVFAGTTDIVWRIVWTGVLSAASSALMIWFASWTERAPWRGAGLLGLAAVVAEFLLTLALIWEFRVISPPDFSEHLAETIGAVGVMVVPAMVFLRRAVATDGRWLGRVGVGVCLVTLLVFLVGIWFDGGSERSWMTGWLVGGFGVLAAASFAGFPQRRWPWRWVGVAAALAGAAMSVTATWRGASSGGLLFAVITGLAVCVPHAALAFICPLRPEQRWIRWGTIAAAALTSLLLDVGVATETLGVEFSPADRAAVASAIVAACGSLSLVVLSLLNRKFDPTAMKASVEHRELSLVCPHCAIKQVLSVGDSQCASCGLRFHIQLEEPRCAGCGYLLYMRSSDRCPECGLVINQQGTAPPTTIDVRIATP